MARCFGDIGSGLTAFSDGQDLLGVDYSCYDGFCFSHYYPLGYIGHRSPKLVRPSLQAVHDMLSRIRSCGGC